MLQSTLRISQSQVRGMYAPSVLKEVSGLELGASYVGLPHRVSCFTAVLIIFSPYIVQHHLQIWLLSLYDVVVTERYTAKRFKLVLLQRCMLTLARGQDMKGQRTECRMYQ